MPLKLGKGGEGQELYSDETGKYLDDGIPNKSEYVNNSINNYKNNNDDIFNNNRSNEKAEYKIFESKIVHKNQIKEIMSYFDMGNDYVKKIACKEGMVRTVQLRPNYGLSYCQSQHIFIDEDALHKERILWHELFHSFNNGNVLCMLKILSNGKTFYETMLEETEKINFEELQQQLQNNFQDYVYSIAGYDRKKHDYLKQKYEDDFFDYYISVHSFEVKRKNNEITENEYAESIKPFETQKENLDIILQQIQEMEKKFQEVEKDCQQFDKYGDFGKYYEQAYNSQIIISDLMSGCTDNKLNLGFFHPENYWQNKKMFSPGIVADELFANLGAAKALNNNVSINLFRKYFPNIYSAFEELYDNLDN